MAGLDLKIEIGSLFEFYKESNNVTPFGDKSMWNSHNRHVDESFVGLSLKDIEKHMYHYTPGIKHLQQIEGEINLGGSKKLYKFDELDGDEMSMERYYEGAPAMRKRLRTGGEIGTGKFVTIHCNIVENWFIGQKQMQHKAATCVSIVDFLESLGYRVQVVVGDLTKRLGTYKDQYINSILVEIVVKRFEADLNKASLLTAVSPWMLRYHMFKFHTANFKCNYGMGSAAKFNKKDTESDIYIDQGQCLDSESSKQKIKEIMEKFSKDK